MLHYKEIEKIHPLILFFIFVIALSSILPLVFYAPRSFEKQNFTDLTASGTMELKLHSNELLFTLILTSVHDQSLFYTKHIFGVEITINSLDTYPYYFIADNLTPSTLPLTYNCSLNLKSDYQFSQSIDVQITLNLISTVEESYNFQIGRFSFSLYARWIFITLFFSIIALTITTRIFKKRNTTTLIMNTAKSFFKSSYASYESLLAKLTDNEIFIFFSIPYILLFCFLNVYYTNFSIITQSSYLFYNLKVNLFVLLLIHLFLLINSPIIINWLVDRYSRIANRLINKNYQKNSLIYLPIFTVFYGILAFITYVFPYQFLLLLILPFTIIFNIGLYYISLKYHCWRYHYKTTDQFIFRVIISYRIFYTLIIFFFSLLFVFASSSFPTYLLLI